METSVSGKVYLVGAGPGDPGLITVRGRDCLERADVVLYDGLANEQLLAHAKGAQCICVGKHGRSPIWTQPAIDEEMVQLAKQGLVVVRLKGGDPAIFARTAEEVETLTAERIPFELVPGITAALAAASYVGIPLTHRRFASAVALITGQQQTADPPQPIEWHALARFPGTLVFYMGVTTVAEWTSRLLEAGKPSATPAAIVRRCTWSDQTVIRCKLGEVVEHLTPASKMRPPVIVIVGEVATLGGECDWFISKPLLGQGVWIPRAEHQAIGLRDQLREMGAEPFIQPVFRITPPEDSSQLNHATQLLQLSGFDGVTFSSSNGVDGLLNHLLQSGLDARTLAGTRLAAVGPSTADQMKHYGLRCDVIPDRRAGFSAQGLVQTLHQAGEGDNPGEPQQPLAGQHWLVTTTSRSRGTLSEGLVQLGARTTEALTYVTVPEETLPVGLEQAIHSGRLQWVVVTSQFVGEVVHRLLGDRRKQVSPVALSHELAAKLERLGWPAAAVAAEHTEASLIAAIEQAVQQRLVAK